MFELERTTSGGSSSCQDGLAVVLQNAFHFGYVIGSAPLARPSIREREIVSMLTKKSSQLLVLEGDILETPVNEGSLCVHRSSVQSLEVVLGRHDSIRSRDQEPVLSQKLSNYQQVLDTSRSSSECWMVVLFAKRARDIYSAERYLRKLRTRRI
jgi:hypothetical protein